MLLDPIEYLGENKRIVLHFYWEASVGLITFSKDYGSFVTYNFNIFPIQ
jgi:hypothetical protein